jgi:RNA polymerase sigma factor (TIGR02999 family)
LRRPRDGHCALVAAKSAHRNAPKALVKPESGTLTGLLRRSAMGDVAARDAVWAMAHAELRDLARARLARESGAPTWQPTELVHEAFLKLCGLEMGYQDRAHFLAMAATAMRQVLVDHARARQRDKRGGGQRAVTLDTGLVASSNVGAIDVLDLDRALDTLAGLDARKARAIELSYFGGMADREVAEVLDVSEPTVKRDLRSARAWLAATLDAPA